VRLEIWLAPRNFVAAWSVLYIAFV
jgi:hypothetical protein